ncbi:MAG: RagB/SusD family nutrient uptake outer membrane protein [Porphyromonadaceae bacterium CG2_30_38_12]|nr:MAG: RagB/SusD family nutrient uptake outer membrane protein [Porphyromonadaceae bacterium CG2_30_38_12]
MKKNIFYFLGIISLLHFTACDKLDREVITTWNKEEVNSIYSLTKDRATAMYADLPNGFTEIDGAMLASATDEAEHTLETSDVQSFNAGSWDAVTNPDNVWSNYFKAIRNVNLFLANSDGVNMDPLKLDPTKLATYNAQVADIKRWKYEGQFLRSYYYFELIKRYGGVPIITNVLYLGDNVSNIQRDSLAKCVRFIVNECDTAAKYLPVKPVGVELGRASKGAAMALKAKVLLYAASDLWNTPSWATGYANAEFISLPDGNNPVIRTARWKAAADAAKAVIDLAGTGYALALDYKAMFLGSQGYNSTEHIFVRRNAASNEFEKAVYPIGFDLAKSGNAPSQNLVDAYEVKKSATVAEAFDWSNPAHAANLYTGRDPRLEASVITNNSLFKARGIEIWTGGKDGKGINLATKTGYYLKKYVDENLDLNLGTTSIHTWSLIRLADVYLWYAEALNEYSPGHADIKKYVDLVRERKTVEMPKVPAGKTQTEMRDIIRHERHVELAFEGHRAWDLRRWMTAPAVLGAELKGVQITQTTPGVYSYAKIKVEDRVFTPKMYFYPIPQSEILKMSNWKQNPLW